VEPSEPEVKPEPSDDVKPELEEDGEGDVAMPDGDAQAAPETVKQEDGAGEEAVQTKKSVKKKVSFADDQTPQSSKKRTAKLQDSEEEASEEEPPTKKQRRKQVAKPKETTGRKTIKKEDIEDDESAANEPDTTATKPVKSIKQNGDKLDKPKGSPSKEAKIKPPPPAMVEDAEPGEATESDPQSEVEAAEESDEELKPEKAAKTREKVQTTLKSISKDPYPDWKAGDPVPYAALCTTFSKIEMTTKRLEILAHCSLFLRQVLRLTPQDLLPTVLLMLGKLAADYAGVELGIGESLIMKAIGETTGRSLQTIKADQQEIGDLGLVAAKSRSNQPPMFKPKPLTVKAVHEGLMGIALLEGQGAQGRKVGGIKKLLSAADIELFGKGKAGVDITQDKGGPSESKFIVRTLEGKMRLGLADKTVLVALANAAVHHEYASKDKKEPSHDQIGQGETMLKNVYK